MVIVALQLTTQGQADMMLEIFVFSGNIDDSSNAQVSGVSHIAERHSDLKKLKDRLYNDNLKSLNSYH